MKTSSVAPCIHPMSGATTENSKTDAQFGGRPQLDRSVLFLKFGEIYSIVLDLEITWFESWNIFNGSGFKEVAESA